MKTFATILFTALAVVGIAGAQGINSSIKLHLDQAVMVGETSIPAGDCTIQVLNGNSDTLALLVRSAAGMQTTVMINHINPIDARTHNAANVTLKSHDGRFWLDTVWISGDQGFQVLEPVE